MNKPSLTLREEIEKRIRLSKSELACDIFGYARGDIEAELTSFSEGLTTPDECLNKIVDVAMTCLMAMPKAHEYMNVPNIRIPMPHLGVEYPDAGDCIVTSSDGVSVTVYMEGRGDVIIRNLCYAFMAAADQVCAEYNSDKISFAAAVLRLQVLECNFQVKKS
jgi:hypothetical protein